MPQADLFTVRRYMYSGITCTDHENYLPRKGKTACSVRYVQHENYIQHSYGFFFSLSYKPSLYPQRVVSRGVLRDGFLYKKQDRRHATVADITFRGPHTSRNSRD